MVARHAALLRCQTRSANGWTRPRNRHDRSNLLFRRLGACLRPAPLYGNMGSASHAVPPASRRDKLGLSPALPSLEWPTHLLMFAIGRTSP